MSQRKMREMSQRKNNSDSAPGALCLTCPLRYAPEIDRVARKIAIA